MTRKNPENQPKLPVESPVSESRPTLESPENVPNTIDRIVDFVKCTVFQVCKKAEVTRETKKAIREKLLLADLGKLLPYHPYVGDTSMSRRLLFGADPKIREIYGSFASESDRKAWDSFMKLPVDQRIKYPLYTTLASKR